ncbi:hypothetical protein COLO4_36184 [Corchorus olitorius]|uniref:AMP-activated protein kinase glycogen-binding domain-containing protein n=1 Tax=Corchorus olitorius TaxID=93759 RepID=A0A1R3GAV2_9ROSI|nr:hypothetical protein COLO4_36184 [Corchorus olitorius]
MIVTLFVNQRKKANLASLKLNLVRSLEFGEAKKRVYRWSCWCKKGGDKDPDLALEAEILEFMRNSEKPDAFPSKKDLVDAGRMDLVEGIKRQGGWLTMGWDLDDDKDNEFQENGAKYWDFVVKENECGAESIESEVESRGSSSSTINSCLPSSSGRSQEVVAEDDSGIEVILSRLERERNINFGFGIREKGHNNTSSQSNDSEEESLVQSSMDMTVGDPGRKKLVSFNHSTGFSCDNGVKSSQNSSISSIGLRNSTWREWSLQRAGFTANEFEDKSSELDRRKESHAPGKDIDHNGIHSRLEHLKSELSSVLHSLRSNVDEVLTHKGDESSTDNLHKLSDAWEFQETEIMNAQDKLRSIRARLAVLEGKMALAIIDAQKTAEEKQKRINDARRALQLLRPACIVWPNSGSEVLLAGSFDGWATKRKMEKSSTGVFSVSLKLYPGRYEIKFIVDGEWKIDPLRPIVNNNGFANNLLIIT